MDERMATSAEKIKEQLFTTDRTVSVVRFRTLDSTNDEAKRMISSGVQSPTVLIADHQSNGRGRLGRSFYSPDGEGLYMSIFCPVENVPASVAVTGAASVAVMRAIREVCKIQTEIKWVNDLYFRKKKVCGILTEGVENPDRRFFVIVGIGINLTTETFPGDLSKKAGSLCVHIGKEQLAAAIFRELLPFLKMPSDRSWIKDYRAYSLVIGKKISWTDHEQILYGDAIGINDDGELIALCEDGKEYLLRTGEISVRLV